MLLIMYQFKFTFVWLHDKTMRVLFVTDVHIKHKNSVDVELLIEKLKTIEDFDFAVLAGDVLDTHERVDVQLMNKAYELVHVLRKKSKVYVIVGNHDMINNQQFLTANHWMNGMKEWANVIVVDKPHVDGEFIFVPYVPPGRFTEALGDMDWKNKKCIFAHQEFRGCKLGIINSTDGDEWEPEWPLVISGHIHERHNPYVNVWYPGNLEPRIFDFTKPEVTEEYIPLGLKQKKTVHVNATDDDVYDDVDVNLIVNGTVEEITAFKEKHKKLESKVSFRLTSAPDRHNTIGEPVSFSNILFKMVTESEDENLIEDYNYLTRVK